MTHPVAQRRQHLSAHLGRQQPIRAGRGQTEAVDNVDPRQWGFAICDLQCAFWGEGPVSARVVAAGVER